MLKNLRYLCSSQKSPLSVNTPLATLHLNSFTDPGYSTKQVNEAKVTSKHCIGLFRMKIGVFFGFLGTGM